MAQAYRSEAVDKAPRQHRHGDGDERIDGDAARQQFQGPVLDLGDEALMEKIGRDDGRVADHGRNEGEEPPVAEKIDPARPRFRHAACVNRLARLGTLPGKKGAQGPAEAEAEGDDERRDAPHAGPAEDRDPRDDDRGQQGLARREAERGHARRPAANACRKPGRAHHACMARHALAEEAQGEKAQAQHHGVGGQRKPERGGCQADKGDRGVEAHVDAIDRGPGPDHQQTGTEGRGGIDQSEGAVREPEGLTDVRP
ncbi:hypothetical protein RE429_18010 [Microvirga sp. M2]